MCKRGKQTNRQNMAASVRACLATAVVVVVVVSVCLGWGFFFCFRLLLSFFVFSFFVFFCLFFFHVIFVSSFLFFFLSTLSVSLPVCLHISTFLCQSASRSACLSVCQPVVIYFSLSVCLHASTSVCQSASRSACLSVCLPVCPSVCLPVWSSPPWIYPILRPVFRELLWNTFQFRNGFSVLSLRVTGNHISSVCTVFAIKTNKQKTL